MSKINDDESLLSDDSSYNIKMISLEDSMQQTQQFATPSIIYWPNVNYNNYLYAQTQTNKTSYDAFSSQLNRQRPSGDNSTHNLSNVEKRRGLVEPNIVAATLAPDRTLLDTSDLTTVTKTNHNRSHLDQNDNAVKQKAENQVVDTKKESQNSRKLDSSFSSDFNVSKLQKRLEFSSLSNNDDTIMSEPVTKIEKSKTRLYELSECVDEDEDHVTRCEMSRLKNRTDKLIEQSRMMIQQTDQPRLFELEQHYDDEDDDEEGCDTRSEYIENININVVKFKNKQNEVIQNVRMNSSKAFYAPQSSNIMVNQQQFVQMKKTFNSVHKNNDKEIKKSPCVAWDISPKKRAHDKSSKQMEYHSMPKREKIQSSLQIAPRKLDIDFKENQRPFSNEISTQTSFVVHTSNECGVASTSSSQTKSIRSASVLTHTLKLADEIQKKKLKHLIAAQRHEKKSRQLEELMESERARAERIQRMLLEMSNSSSSYSMMSSISHSNLNCIHDDIQIVEFDSQSVKPPSHVQVIKENSNNNILRRQLSKQTTELVENCDGTIMSLPITEKLEVTRVKQFSVSTDRINQVSRMTLQEAFQQCRPKIVERIAQRQKKLEENSKLRQEQAEFERRLNEKQLKIKEEEEARKRQEMWRERYLACQASRMKGRSMTESEMRTLTRRNYERLPEVKQKVLRERLEHEKKLNQIRSKLYNNTIKRHVLMNGPNFELRFNALK